MSTGSKDPRAPAHIALVGGLSSDEVWMANVSHRKIRKILSEVHREFMASRYYDPQESAGKTKRATVMKTCGPFQSIEAAFVTYLSPSVSSLAYPEPDAQEASRMGWFPSASADWLPAEAAGRSRASDDRSAVVQPW